ncbi:MAG: hypothetical protein M0Z58_08990 [Nitrospiraceae bacterium]|nr:hypothetical protein [Nitrospiraceae bacterium]
MPLRIRVRKSPGITASLLAACLVLAAAAPVFAGPPFLTDDPVPVALGHYEFYVFSTFDDGQNGTVIQAPAFEFNAGIAPDTQFHLVLPFTVALPEGGPSACGPGDTEAGIKYRFMGESKNRPQAGIFPMIELPSGSASRGLGNGRAQEKIPVWLQKSFGPWTTYGGMGYTINQAPYGRNYLFGGWLLQKDISEKLTLGGEVFALGATADDERSTAIFNFGGYYNFTGNMSLLFTAGHSFLGGRHFVGYLGLYWTGPIRPAGRRHIDAYPVIPAKAGIL